MIECICELLPLWTNTQALDCMLFMSGSTPVPQQSALPLDLRFVPLKLRQALRRRIIGGGTQLGRLTSI